MQAFCFMLRGEINLKRAGKGRREEIYRNIELFNLHGLRMGLSTRVWIRDSQCVMNCLRMRHEVAGLGFDLLRQTLRGMCPCRQVGVCVCMWVNGK